jgi:hypothetical protein
VGNVLQLLTKGGRNYTYTKIKFLSLNKQNIVPIFLHKV